MSKKISLGVAATIAIIAMAVTFSLTMVVSMKMFNTTVSSVKNKERQTTSCPKLIVLSAQGSISPSTRTP